MGLGDFLKSKESKETKDRSKSSKSSKSQQQKSQTTISALVAPDTKKRVDAKPGADAQGKTPDKQAVFDRQSPNVAKILEVSRADEKMDLTNRRPEFVASAGSALLVVNGNARSINAQSTMTMKSFSVKYIMVGRLQSMSRLLLTWFSTQHTGLKDPLRGVVGMLRGLCMQLLCRGDVVGGIDLSPFDDERPRRLNVADACSFLRNLVLAVSKVKGQESICCIIDGIHELEDHEDFQYAFDFLKNLVREFNLQHNPTPFRVLLTHPTTSNLSTVKWIGEYGSALTYRAKEGRRHTRS
ncbi:hypothetical protein LTR37_019080 [Vermiconidia calcicola]|uniref:Uncharacterized protein n=1 Tax=Vermiconidia calcicola TaxID=1690605 RepID=A0ACC3MI94_9PEZI|nr:hypothetical protein LTR37_019080 [Vermiconidia calcicola]